MDGGDEAPRTSCGRRCAARRDAAPRGGPGERGRGAGPGETAVESPGEPGQRPLPGELGVRGRRARPAYRGQRPAGDALLAERGPEPGRAVDRAAGQPAPALADGDAVFGIGDLTLQSFVTPAR